MVAPAALPREVECRSTDLSPVDARAATAKATFDGETDRPIWVSARDTRQRCLTRHQLAGVVLSLI
jgi:hypothetical protein